MSPDNFGLLLPDVALPDRTGFEVCERVRKDNLSIPIIFLTAADEEVNIIRGLDGGGADYATAVIVLVLCVSLILAVAGPAKKSGACQLQIQFTLLIKHENGCAMVP